MTDTPSPQTTGDHIDLRLWHDDAGYLIHGVFSLVQPQSLEVLIEAMTALRPLLVAQEQRNVAEIANAE